jgi:hypothetical protein
MEFDRPRAKECETLTRKSRALGVPLLMILLGAALASASKPESDYPVKEVPLTSVKFTDTFWAPRQRTDISVTIPHEMKQCELTGRIRNFETAGGEARGKFATGYAFDDSDVYKVIEAAAYTLMLRPNSELEEGRGLLGGKDCQSPGAGRVFVYGADDRPGEPSWDVRARALVQAQGQP